MFFSGCFQDFLFITCLITICLGVVVFTFYPAWDSLGFLALWVWSLHYIWKIFSHCFFRYFSCRLCINHLVLRKCLPQNLVAWNNIYYLVVSVGQKSRHCFSGCSASRSLADAIKVCQSRGCDVMGRLQGGRVHSLSGCWQRSVPCGCWLEPRFLTDFWLKVTFSFLPHGPPADFIKGYKPRSQ